MKILLLVAFFAAAGAAGYFAVVKRDLESRVAVLEQQKREFEAQQQAQVEAAAAAQGVEKQLQKGTEEAARLRGEVAQLRRENQKAQQEAQRAQQELLQAAQFNANQTKAMDQLQQRLQEEGRQRLAGAVPQNIQVGQRDASSCLQHLRMIEGAKQQWALENRIAIGSPVQANNLIPYLRKPEEILTCPDGGTYTLNNVGFLKAKCSVPGHALPD
jgi:hypothetical protein